MKLPLATLLVLTGCTLNEKQPRVDLTLQFESEEKGVVQFDHYSGEPKDQFHILRNPTYD